MSAGAVVSIGMEAGACVPTLTPDSSYPTAHECQPSLHEHSPHVTPGSLTVPTRPPRVSSAESLQVTRMGAQEGAERKKHSCHPVVCLVLLFLMLLPTLGAPG